MKIEEQAEHPSQGLRFELTFPISIRARQSDVVRLGFEPERGNRFALNSHKGGVALDILLLLDLRIIIDATDADEWMCVEGFGRMASR